MTGGALGWVIVKGHFYLLLYSNATWLVPVGEGNSGVSSFPAVVLSAAVRCVLGLRPGESEGK